MRSSECAPYPGILYKLTTADCRCKDGDTIWGERVEHTAPGWRYNQLIRAYRDPLVAALLDPVHAKYGASALLWECEGDVCSDDVTNVYCTHLRTKHRIPLPDLTIEQRVEVGIRCALAQHHTDTFKQWAERWLLDKDRSEAAAQAVPPAGAIARVTTQAAEAAAAGARERAISLAAAAAAWTTTRAVGSFDLAAVCRQVVYGQVHNAECAMPTRLPLAARTEA